MFPSLNTLNVTEEMITERVDYYKEVGETEAKDFAVMDEEGNVVIDREQLTQITITLIAAELQKEQVENYKMQFPTRWQITRSYLMALGSGAVLGIIAVLAIILAF